VLGIARLGEADLKGWWRSHGLDRAGSFVLKRAFPRTWAPAGLEIDVMSARRRHDDALGGRSTALHLFSDELPFRRWASAWLSEQKTASVADPLIEELTGWDVDVATERLREWTDDVGKGEEIADGLRLGRLTRSEIAEQSKRRSVARRLGGAYLALDATFKAPYFDLAS
jgi:hypothetical protein